MEVILLAIVFVGISFLALGVNIFFTKKGKFPDTEVGKNPKMKELGLACAKCEEHKNYRKALKKRKPKLSAATLKLDVDGLSC